MSTSTTDTPADPTPSDPAVDAPEAVAPEAVAPAGTDPLVEATAQPDPAPDELAAAAPLEASAPVPNSLSSENAPTFAELGVAPEIVSALAAAGIERTFAIQELTLPLALAGEDVIGQARTGTGKTLGFGVPLLQRIDRQGDGTPQALVVVPTRELCLQVAKDLDAAAKDLGTRVLSIYGGRPYEQQISALQTGVELVVGTPGRLLDLAQQGHLVLAKVRGLVLDEADEMLDLGFLPDVERILGMLPEKRQTMLFSATMPGPIITLARTFLTRPTHIRAEQVDATAIGERTAQFVYRAHAMDKVEMLARTLQATDRGSTMVFTRTKRTASKVSEELAERGFKVGAVHGDLGQGAREHALKAFRTGRIDVLVCTDVAARGIDVTGVTHVINYQCPDDAKTYIHRIGRTGRAGADGVAVTLVDWDDLPKWKLISDDLALGAPVPPETYSNSPHLHADLHIPDDASGRVARRRRPAEEEADGPAPAADAPADADTSEGRGRGRSRSRSRTRRRGGEVVAGSGAESGAEAAPAAHGATTGPSPSGPGSPAAGGAEGDADVPRKRRRRRGRGGRGGAQTADATGPDTAAPNAAAVDAD